ncbi:E3 ubiquitin-protein ligase CCNB1IP1-like [Planoprotostelium fungivorum]|uniref:E3 ubiquitin-protein ligase CCNB1IP1-like n=1 Tax=Planoprotostelium fungivorum TaxID=1890364 RepID=A0A2P6MN66_9EUKA|nr:E3 ubiquitin-protein ligase CCNB1IP1-like [Planoprotostelium fungivorum]
MSLLVLIRVSVSIGAALVVVFTVAFFEPHSCLIVPLLWSNSAQFSGMRKHFLGRRFKQRSRRTFMRDEVQQMLEGARTGDSLHHHLFSYLLNMITGLDLVVDDSKLLQLCGLNPKEIMDVSSRALNFWAFQMQTEIELHKADAKRKALEVERMERLSNDKQLEHSNQLNTLKHKNSVLVQEIDDYKKEMVHLKEQYEDACRHKRKLEELCETYRSNHSSTTATSLFDSTDRSYFSPRAPNFSRLHAGTSLQSTTSHINPPLSLSLPPSRPVSRSEREPRASPSVRGDVRSTFFERPPTPAPGSPRDRFAAVRSMSPSRPEPSPLGGRLNVNRTPLRKPTPPPNFLRRTNSLLGSV